MTRSLKGLLSTPLHAVRKSLVLCLRHLKNATIRKTLPKRKQLFPERSFSKCCASASSRWDSDDFEKTHFQLWNALRINSRIPQNIYSAKFEIKPMDDFMLMETENRDGEALGNPQDSLTTDPTIADPTTVAEALSKTRRTQVKLTAERLLCDKGLPHLVKHGPKRLRISTSRNTPYENLSRIVRFYQLWAHELYPKAKFRDFIKITRGLKNDRALKEYRINLCLDEMAPNTHKSLQDQGPNEESNSKLDAVNHVEQEDEDIYTDSLIEARAEGQEEMLDTQLGEEFDEDHDALEAMKDMGF